MNENWTKFIELLLQGELSPEDTEKLQAELERNPDMRASLEQQKRVHEIAKRSGERAVIKNIGRGYQFQSKFKTGLFSVLVAGALATVAYFTVNNIARKGKTNVTTEVAVETGKYQKLDDKSELANLPISYFEHDGKNATFMSPKGVLLSVPKKTFVLDGKPYGGKAVIQYQEALDATDIVKAGLSTTSGDRLLETQGMFGLKAFTPDGRELKINDKDGIYLQVPVEENKKGMQLFQGVKNAQGEIDWQKPAPIEKLPVQANMLDLDMFPPGFEPKLDELKWNKKKKKRDSLYLSFEESFETEVTKSKPIIRDTIGSATESVIMPVHDYFVPTAPIYDGKSLFNNKCATCHNIHKNSTGPKLYQVREKWINAGVNPGLIYTWVRDWESAYLQDEYAKKMASWSPTVSTNFPELKNDEINAIFNYIDSDPLNELNDSTSVTEAATEGVLDTKCPLPPSKVLAIWKKKFNGTILATRDFENRMKAIHSACDEKVFDVYANQINKPLWQLDEQVVRMGHSNFQKFADERVGALKQDNAHMNTLRQFYQSNVSRLKDMAKKDKNVAKAIRMAWDRKLKNNRNSAASAAIQRARTTYQEEFKMNFDNMLDQLGRKKTVGVTIRGNSYGAKTNYRTTKTMDTPVSRGTASAVYNIDRFTRVNTWNRTSAEFKDKNGKTAKLVYNKMKAKIRNAAKYGQLFLYLLPKQLNSFHRINPKKGMFDYSLNGDIQYDAIFVGINDNGYFLAEEKNLKGGDLGEIKLNSVNEKEFERRIERMNEKRNAKPLSISNELSWLKTERKDYVVQSQRKKMAKFRNKMRGIVYPCGNTNTGESYFYQESEKSDPDNPFL